MLIYSFEKEFIGIDERYLRIFGYADLATLQKEHKDFADFFVKQPGYIHNFKHVHWIDFIDCAESVEESKVMIDIHGKSFTANIAISTIYLSESPTSKSYIIKLNNLRQLSGDTGDKVLIDIPEEEPPAEKKREVYTQPKVESILLDELETPQEKVLPKEPIAPKVVEKEKTPQKTPQVVSPIVIEEPEDDKPLDIDMEIEEEVETRPEETFIPQDDYVFDPNIASDELGLPVDLIEEFIEDFIAQAREFQPTIYTALENGDIETVATLSHKLKGVAGNLRIENAYDKLCIINDSKDARVIKSNLDIFYRIVAQLAGEEVKMAAPVHAKVEQPAPTVEVDVQEEDKVVETPPDILLDDDDFVLEFKDEEDATELIPIEIEDEEEDTAELIPIEIEDEEELEPDVVVSYSKTVAANEIGLDADTFNELLEDYTKAAFDLLDEMKEAVALDDIEKCRKKALLLKNMSDSMYIKDLASDLLSIANNSDKNSMTVAINNINAMIKQISK